MIRRFCNSACGPWPWTQSNATENTHYQRQKINGIKTMTITLQVLMPGQPPKHSRPIFSPSDTYVSKLVPATMQIIFCSRTLTEIKYIIFSRFIMTFTVDSITRITVRNCTLQYLATTNRHNSTNPSDKPFYYSINLSNVSATISLHWTTVLKVWTNVWR